jgi:Alkylmercury lyase
MSARSCDYVTALRIWEDARVGLEDLRLGVYRSFALPQVLPDEGEVLVSTRCPACSHPHAWNVGTERPPDGDQVAHFLVPAAHMWDDVVHTCRHQRLFCSEDCVSAWCRQTGATRGYVMDLRTLWRFASHWYDGRLDRGYVRREPEAATEYLRSVGLSGPILGPVTRLTRQR